MVEEETGISTRNISEVESIYDGEKLDFNAIKKNPILKPIVEINNSFQNFELVINRALWEYEQNKKTIDEMIEANPKYSETMIMAKVQSLLGHIKQIIHSQDIQKENMKNAINEMIKIVGDEYGLLQEPEEPTETPKVGGLEPIQEEVDKEKDNKKDEEEKKFHSELLDKKINLPNKDEFIPIKK